MTPMSYPEQDEAWLRRRSLQGHRELIALAHSKAMTAREIRVNKKWKGSATDAELASRADIAADERFARVLAEVFDALQKDLEAVPVIHDKEVS